LVKGSKKIFFDSSAYDLNFLYILCIGNKLLYGKGQHKVMVVGGPNQRKDYHIEAGEVCIS